MFKREGKQTQELASTHQGRAFVLFKCIHISLCALCSSSTINRADASACNCIPCSSDKVLSNMKRKETKDDKSNEEQHRPAFIYLKKQWLKHCVLMSAGESGTGNLTWSDSCTPVIPFLNCSLFTDTPKSARPLNLAQTETATLEWKQAIAKGISEAKISNPGIQFNITQSGTDMAWKWAWNPHWRPVRQKAERFVLQHVWKECFINSTTQNLSRVDHREQPAITLH